MRLSVAAVQMESMPFALDENLSRAAEHVAAAHRAGATFVVLPELFSTGYAYDRRLLDHKEPVGGPTTRWMQQQSIRRQIYLAACFVEQGSTGCHDTLMLTAPCGTVHTYRKRYPAFFEKLYFRCGATEGIFHTAIGRIGVMICWDMVQPRLQRELAGKIDLLVISSAWPDMTTGNIPVPFFAKWMSRQPSLAPPRIAAQLGVPVVYANIAGAFRTNVPYLRLKYRAQFAGGSSVTDEQGETLVSTHRGEDIVLASLKIGAKRGGERPALKIFDGAASKAPRRAA